MYLIALCDDEVSELKKAEQMLSGYKEKHSAKNIRTDYFKSARDRGAAGLKRKSDRTYDRRLRNESSGACDICSRREKE